MRNNKKGITVAMAVTMVIIIALLATTITISVNTTLKGSKLKAFATELATIQDTIDIHMKTTTSVDYVVSDIIVTPSVELLATQFAGEAVTDGTILLHVIDLEKLGIEKTVYGNSKTETDVYAVSFETRKVYYVQGYDASDVVYYTLTDELENLLAGEQDVDIVSDNIIFVPNMAGWTKEPIQVTIKVPTNIDVATLTLATNVEEITISTPTLNGNYNDIIVNSGNYAGNYIITVNYILNDETVNQLYEVTNYDSIAPRITVGDLSIYNTDNVYLNDVVALDNVKIKKIMYSSVELTEIEAKKYFDDNGNIVDSSTIKIDRNISKYTIYAEDYAGNFSIKIIDIPALVSTEQELVGAINSGKNKIKLMNGIVCESSFAIDNGNYNIDLNGHTISYNNNTQSFTFMTINSEANVTIQDTSSLQTGKILAQFLEETYNGTKGDRAYDIYTIQNNGVLNIETVEIASKIIQKVGDAKINIGIEDAARTIDNIGTLNVNGGKISSYVEVEADSHAEVRTGEALAVGIQNSGTINLNSGSIVVEAHGRLKKTLGTWGKTAAYAYGVTNSDSGVYKKEDGFLISVFAKAYDEGNTYSEDEDAKEII